MSSVDADAWTLPDPPGGDPNRVELPYVLVADTNVERAAMCLDAIRPFKAGVLVARDGEEAARILERFGPPILLIVDLSLARRDGFAVIEGLRAQRLGRTEIIAWAAFRELSEFAAQRLSGLNVRVLRGGAPADVVQAAIERAFERHSSAASPTDVVTMPSAEELHEIMAALAEKARQLVRTPGVAVYLRAPAATQFRASVTWTSDSPIPHSPYYMPRVFGWILETGESLVLPDLATQPLSDVPTSTLQDVVRGLVAVPITGPNGQIVGTICVFDLKPLVLSDVDVDALKALGRSVTFGKSEPAGCRGRHAANRRSPNQSPRRFPGLRRAGPPAPSRASSSRRANRHQSRRYRCSIGSMESSPPPANSRVPAGKSARSASILFSVSRPGAGPSAQRDDPAALVGPTLIKVIRESDLPIRWAADEVLLVLPGLGLDDARRVAERVRAALQAGTGHRAAVSAGVAELLAAETFGALVTRARERVQLALEHGHNRVA